jgi:hypothetical protein
VKKGLIIIILSLIVKSSFGQQFTDLYGDYLGQTPPGDTPVVFAPGIISTNILEHSASIFSSDGSKVYWCSRENQVSQLNIWFMTRINNRWTKPEILAPFGDSVNYCDPFLSIDNKRFYFTADDPSDSIDNSDIWYIEKQDNQWTKPRSISSVINTTNGQAQTTLTSEGTAYFITYKVISNKWTCNILKSKCKNGNYSQPDTLPAFINSPSQDAAPYIAPDDNYLIFSSNRQNSIGRGDLYISFHDRDTDGWSEPLNMGEPINTVAQEGYSSVSPDGKYLFFTRWNQNSDMDVFWVSTKFIDRLRENNNLKK